VTATVGLCLNKERVYRANGIKSCEFHESSYCRLYILTGYASDLHFSRSLSSTVMMQDIFPLDPTRHNTLQPGCNKGKEEVSAINLHVQQYNLPPI
jgi:hypothetical protein